MRMLVGFIQVLHIYLNLTITETGYRLQRLKARISKKVITSVVQYLLMEIKPLSGHPEMV